MIEFVGHRAQAGFDVPQALAVSQLSEGHRQILIPTREAPVVMIAAVASHTLLKFLVGQMCD
jgi:hypothetical protein